MKERDSTGYPYILIGPVRYMILRREKVKKRLLSAILAAVMLLSLAACASGNSGDASSESAASSKENSLSVISMKMFESKAGKYGKVQDLSGKYGYDAALVSASDKTNYIYMYLPDAKMAESIITDSDGDGEKDKDVKKKKSGSNYAFYLQDGDTVYAQYLRVGNMIIAVTAQPSKKDSAEADAETFFTELGYEM